MAEICSNCGLPKEICACQTIEKETTRKIRVYTRIERFNKPVTVVEGLSGNELKEATKTLKHKLACGGSCKSGSIVLQGNHKEKVASYLMQLGYPKESIILL